CFRFFSWTRPALPSILLKNLRPFGWLAPTLLSRTATWPLSYAGEDPPLLSELDVSPPRLVRNSPDGDWASCARRDITIYHCIRDSYVRQGAARRFLRQSLSRLTPPRHTL